MTFREWYFKTYYPKWKDKKLDPYDVAQTAWCASHANYSTDYEEEIKKLEMTNSAITEIWKLLTRQNKKMSKLLDDFDDLVGTVCPDSSMYCDDGGLADRLEEFRK